MSAVSTGELTLGAIFRHPVKSCRGQSLDSVEVEPWGIAGDRRWMVVEPDGGFLTAREVPRMLLIEPTPREGGGLTLTAPDAAELVVDVPAAAATQTVGVWGDSVEATPASNDAHAWFSGLLSRDVRLVYLDDPRRRAVDEDYGRPGDVVTFADGSPLHLITSASLAQLNALIADGPGAAVGELPPRRFRPNVVIDGGDAWAEDGWRRVRIGDAVFRVVKGCERCVMTTTDPDSAARGKEPIATLARHRRWGGKTWFGMDLIPDNPGAVIRVGDEVEVLESEPAPEGPPR